MIYITYFVHGTTTDNEQGISSGWKDVELSPLGIEQSHQLREQIRSRTFDAVFCSDLKRAVRSAGIAFTGMAPVIEDGRLRECNYGDYNGKPSQIVEPMQQKNITEKFPGGESCEDVKARVENFLHDLKKKYDGKHIAIVGHKVPQLALDVLLKQKTWPQAFAEDWRNTHAWQPGWEYIMK